MSLQDAVRAAEEYVARWDRAEWKPAVQGGGDVVRNLLATLPTPTADDVREALAALRVAVEQDAPDDAYPTLVTVDRKTLADVLAAFEVRPRGTVTEAEKKPVVMHIAGGTGTACGLSRERVSHITDGVRYADCVPCLRTVART